MQTNNIKWDNMENLNRYANIIMENRSQGRVMT